MESTFVSDKPSTTCIVPWFGSNRTLGAAVGEELTGLEWVGIGCAGGLSELLHIQARTVLVNDLHFQVINLAMTLASPIYGPILYRRLRRKLFHSDELHGAQQFLLDNTFRIDEMPDIDAAEAYFVSQWMGRSGKAGTEGELKGKLPVRWNAGGGDSAVRYRSAVRSLLAWRKLLERCNFLCIDVFEFLGKVNDADGHGLYLDPPWPEVGDNYQHKFTEQQQRELAAKLAGYQQTRVVVRYGDHPLIRELYPESHWRWRMLDGRNQANTKKAEVLLVNRVQAAEV